MSKLIAAVGGVLVIGATLVLFFTALFSGQLASYSGGICVPGTTTSATRISPTTTALPAGGASCYPASGKSRNVAMAALSIAAHLSGNPDTRYDAGMPEQVLQFWATACPIGSGCWADWQERAFEVNIPLTFALAFMPTIIASITNFFNNLEQDVVTFALAASTFFFAWAAILYMTSGENQRRIDYAKMSLYAALTGLALALLAGTIAGLVNSAAKGQ